MAEKQDIDLILQNKHKYITLFNTGNPNCPKGVRAISNIRKNTYICEYKGAKHNDQNSYFNSTFQIYINGQYKSSVSAEENVTKRNIAQNINHSKEFRNCKPCLWKSHIFIKTLRHIYKDEEIFYDYGETNFANMEANSWLHT